MPSPPPVLKCSSRAIVRAVDIVAPRPGRVSAGLLRGRDQAVRSGRSGGLRTYRVDQILDLRVLEEEFAVPAGFELPRYWQAYLADFREVLEPPGLRARLALAARATAALYQPRLAGPLRSEG
jgi:hypothetical protein